MPAQAQQSLPLRRRLHQGVYERTQVYMLSVYECITSSFICDDVNSACILSLSMYHGSSCDVIARLVSSLSRCVSSGDRAVDAARASERRQSLQGSRQTRHRLRQARALRRRYCSSAPASALHACLAACLWTHMRSCFNIISIYVVFRSSRLRGSAEN